MGFQRSYGPLPNFCLNSRQISAHQPLKPLRPKTKQTVLTTICYVPKLDGRHVYPFKTTSLTVSLPSSLSLSLSLSLTHTHKVTLFLLAYASTAHFSRRGVFSSMASISSPSNTTTSVHPGRMRVLKERSRPSDGEVGPVVYWMFRDQRIRDNWALIHAVYQGNKLNAPVAVAFNLFDQFLGAKARQLGFMLRGLKQLQGDLQETLQIPFFLFQASWVVHL
jgi:hypothetical protein